MLCKRPWKFWAIKHTEQRFGKQFRGVSQWRLNVLWQQRSDLLVWMKDCFEQDRLNILVGAIHEKKLWGKRDPLPRRTCVLSSIVCQEHNYSCFLARREGRNTFKSVPTVEVLSLMKWAKPFVWTVSSRCSTGTKGKRVWCSCLSHGHSKICRTFAEAAAMTNNVHLPSTGDRKELIATKARWNSEAPILWTGPSNFGAGGALRTWKQASSGLKRRWKAHKVRKGSEPRPRMD